MKKNEFYKDQLEVLKQSKWSINIDFDTLNMNLVNNLGEEIDLKTLGFILEELSEKFEKKKEEYYGEERKFPVDEFTQKRLGLMDYTLINDEIKGNLRNVFEVYHDNNRIFTIDNYSVALNNNLRVHSMGYTAFLHKFDAEKLVTPLQKFVDLYKS